MSLALGQLQVLKIICIQRFFFSIEKLASIQMKQKSHFLKLENEEEKKQFKFFLLLFFCDIRKKGLVELGTWVNKSQDSHECIYLPLHITYTFI